MGGENPNRLWQPRYHSTPLTHYLWAGLHPRAIQSQQASLTFRKKLNGTCLLSSAI